MQALGKIDGQQPSTASCRPITAAVVVVVGRFEGRGREHGHHRHQAVLQAAILEQRLKEYTARVVVVLGVGSSSRSSGPRGSSGRRVGGQNPAHRVQAQLGNLPRVVTARILDRQTSDNRLLSKREVKIAAVEWAISALLAVDAVDNEERKEQESAKLREFLQSPFLE